MSFEMTQEEAAALARFVEILRKRVPGDNWHKPGIENALGGARQRASAPDLACAAIKAACEPMNQTPAIIGLDGPHWKSGTKPPRPLAVKRDERCSVCSEHHDKCRSVWADDHEFESLAEAAKRKAEWAPEAVGGAIAALKAEVAETPPHEPPRGRGLESLADRNPKLRARVDALRAALPEGATHARARAWRCGMTFAEYVQGLPDLHRPDPLAAVQALLDQWTAQTCEDEYTRPCDWHRGIADAADDLRRVLEGES